MERLLKLQEEFRDGKITQGDLSDEDIDKLGKLYDDQIEKLKIQIEDCKKRIEYKKKKLQKKKNSLIRLNSCNNREETIWEK